MEEAAAELLITMTALHVGAPQPDDSEPGLPLAWRQVLGAERRSLFHAAILQSPRGTVAWLTLTRQKCLQSSPGARVARGVAAVVMARRR